MQLDLTLQKRVWKVGSFRINEVILRNFRIVVKVTCYHVVTIV